MIWKNKIIISTTILDYKLPDIAPINKVRSVTVDEGIECKTISPRWCEVVDSDSRIFGRRSPGPAQQRFSSCNIVLTYHNVWNLKQQQKISTSWSINVIILCRSWYKRGSAKLVKRFAYCKDVHESSKGKKTGPYNCTLRGKYLTGDLMKIIKWQYCSCSCKSKLVNILELAKHSLEICKFIKRYEFRSLSTYEVIYYICIRIWP